MQCTGKHTQKQHSDDLGLKEGDENHFHEIALKLDYRNGCTAASLLK